MSAQIHDLGYRGYDGPRLGEGHAARSLTTLGLRHAFGLGRSVRARLLPFGLLACSVLPALVMVSVVAMTKLPMLPVGYSDYTSLLQMVSTIFVAAQAPVIFSRDLRYRTLTLYLARPLRRGIYVAARVVALWLAIALVVLLPVVVLWLGAMLAGLDAGEQSKAFARALPGQLLLVTLLTVIGAVLSSLTTRRGVAIVSIVATLIIGAGVAAALGAVMADGSGWFGEHASWANVLNPYLLVGGLQARWTDAADPGMPTPDGNGDVTFALAFAALTIVGGLAVVLRRYAKAGAA